MSRFCWRHLSLAVAAALCLCANGGDKDWMVIDLTNGVVAYADYDLNTATNTFNTDEYKTTKMAFRRIEAGYYFVQGGTNMAYMARPYYIGIFHVTAAQYALMQNPAANDLSDRRAMGGLSRDGVRGTLEVTDFGGEELFNGGGSSSPIGRLANLVTNGNETLRIDLPTEAMWEVAARAVDPTNKVGRANRWFFGSDAGDFWTYEVEEGEDLSEPGTKAPSPWGLYDVYGNVQTLCLDKVHDYGNVQWTQTPNGTNDENTIQAVRGANRWGYGELPKSSGPGAFDEEYGAGFRLAVIDMNVEPIPELDKDVIDNILNDIDEPIVKFSSAAITQIERQGGNVWKIAAVAKLSVGAPADVTEGMVRLLFGSVADDVSTPAAPTGTAIGPDTDDPADVKVEFTVESSETAKFFKVSFDGDCFVN